MYSYQSTTLSRWDCLSIALFTTILKECHDCRSWKPSLPEAKWGTVSRNLYILSLTPLYGIISAHQRLQRPWRGSTSLSVPFVASATRKQNPSCMTDLLRGLLWHQLLGTLLVACLSILICICGQDSGAICAICLLPCSIESVLAQLEFAQYCHIWLYLSVTVVLRLAFFVGIVAQR